MKLEIEALHGGLVKMTPREAMFEVLDVFENPLPNRDQYDSICQFKYVNEEGKLHLVDIIVVDAEDEVQRGINFLVTEIQIERDDNNAAVD